MIITNGKVYTMENEVFENGYVIFEEGKIKEVGDMANLHSTFKDVIDAKGGYVFPGLIDAHSHLGVHGDSVGFEDADVNEMSDPITPQVRALDAFTPMARTIEEARNAGITCVVTGPGSANPIGGQLIAVKTFGRRVDDMILKAPAAMKMALGENPKRCYGQSGKKAPVTRMATASLIRETLFKAQEYLTAKENGKEVKFDMKMEALIPVLKREIPAHFHCHRAVDIFTAIRIAKEFNLDYAIIHGSEGHLVAEELVAENVQIASGPNLTHRGKPEVQNKTFAAPGILSKAGVMVSITVDHPVTPIQYLTTCAAYAVKEGMDEMEAFKAITINPAKIGRIDNRVGSLKEGKDADIVIFDGNPLDISTKAVCVIIDGEIRQNLNK